MKRFQNVGTFDAGVIASSGGAVPGGNAMAMDAAGVASGMAFLTSELEKRDSLLRKPLTSVTYPETSWSNPAAAGWTTSLPRP